MKLTLDRMDLRPEFENMNCGLTKFEHFTATAQGVIAAVGKGTFREFDGSNYNVIYPPKGVVIKPNKG